MACKRNRGKKKQRGAKDSRYAGRNWNLSVLEHGAAPSWERIVFGGYHSPENLPRAYRAAMHLFGLGYQVECYSPGAYELRIRGVGFEYRPPARPLLKLLCVEDNLAITDGWRT